MDREAKVHLVQAALGHVSVAIMGRYFHARPDESSALHLAQVATERKHTLRFEHCKRKRLHAMEKISPPRG